MNAFQIMADPVKRRILECLIASDHSSGEVVSVIQKEFGTTQASISQHLKTLRESGLAEVREDGTRRIYSLDASPLMEIDTWISPFRDFFENRLNALHSEIEHDKREQVKKN